MNKILRVPPDVIRAYTSVDQETWRTLSERVKDFERYLCPEFLWGLEALGISGERIPHPEEVSARLRNISGWRLVPVSGMIRTKTGFFRLIVRRIYPVCWAMRSPQDIDFAQEPDWGHDSRHTAMLTNRYVGDFLQRLGAAGIRASSPEARQEIWRLYFSTIETGLIRGKPYGAACASSRKEMIRCLNPENQVPFNPERIMKTSYDDRKPQLLYSVIGDFSELLDIFP